MSNVIATLRQFPLLSSLTDQELELLLKHTEPVSFERGDYLFHEGEPGDALYLLWQGMVVVERRLDPEAGKSKDLAIIPAQSLVGELVLAGDRVRSASVRAELPSHTCRLSIAAFEQLQRESPPIATKLYRALFNETSHRLRATSDELIALYEVGRYVATATRSQDVASAIVGMLRARLGASHVLVACYESGTNALRVLRVVGDAPQHLLDATIPLDQGLVARSFDEKTPLLIEQLLGASEAWESPSMVLAPIVDHNRSVGMVLVGGRPSGEHYRLSDMLLVAGVTNVASAVLRDSFRGGCDDLPPSGT